MYLSKRRPNGDAAMNRVRERLLARGTNVRDRQLRLGNGIAGALPEVIASSPTARLLRLYTTLANYVPRRQLTTDRALALCRSDLDQLVPTPSAAAVTRLPLAP